MTQSKLNDEMEAPLDPASSAPRKHGALGQTDPNEPRQTGLRPSRVATLALALATVTALTAIGTAIGRLLDVLSERQMLAPLEACLWLGFVTATLSGLGWMHSRRRRDGGVDRAGLRRARMAAVLAAVMIAGVTMSLGLLHSPQGIGTEISEDPPP